jgi:hypothetical protein
VRAVWSALTIAETDLETVWLVPHGKTFIERRSVRDAHRPEGFGRSNARAAAWTPTARSWCSAPTRYPDAPDGRLLGRAVAHLRRMGWEIGAVARCPACAPDPAS